ncbi:sirA-like protein [Sulfurifustis variabilis]|uniref:SirA-like protein n=1 Tax=Sulfurifustis variabilis TaxID=1675686 RepID=A0A1C7AFM2_9GAMM|nr:sulfurtransferase TusA family protein [Sulfurifustis variabilis]BAU50155.1 sirA-like protein [Sulfurifustis variabilis]
MSHRVLDVRYLLCPLPVIRTQDTVAACMPGDTLEVRATDPGALHDIPAWCRVHGHSVISAGREGGEVRVTLRVGDA